MESKLLFWRRFARERRPATSAGVLVPVRRGIGWRNEFGWAANFKKPQTTFDSSRDRRLSLGLLAGGGVGQAIGFSVKFATNVGNREFQTAGKLAAGPVQGIKARAAAGVDSSHLLDDDLRIGVDVQGAGFQKNCALKAFEQGEVLGNVVVLPADPLGNLEFAVANPTNDNSNAGRPRISQRTTVDISH